jgi:4-hydroxybenzoate polyprenyltransferase
MPRFAAPQRDAPLPDAKPDNWVDRLAPTRLRPWLKLGRLDRPAGAWLLLLPGWQGIALAAALRHEQPDVLLMIKVAIGALVMRAAGCAYNDIVDRDIDAKVARTAMRPIPSGQISVGRAWAFVVLCSLIGLWILLGMNLWAVGFGGASLLLVAAYPFMKRITWWPQAWLGLTFNWGALLGFAAATGGAAAITVLVGEYAVLTGKYLSFFAVPGSPPGLPAILLYASGVFWTLGYDTIYAVQDLEDDALAGVKSSARRLGAAAPRGVLIFYLICSVLALAVGLTAKIGLLFYPCLVAFVAHLIWQAWRMKLTDPQGALKLFRANRDAGLILAAALALGAVQVGSF